MSKNFRRVLIAVILGLVLVVFGFQKMKRIDASNDWDYVENLIEKEKLDTLENDPHTPILKDGDERIVDNIFKWVKNSKKDMWSCIEFWVDDNSELVKYADWLVTDCRYDRRKVGMYTQDFHHGTLVRLYSNTVRVEKWSVERFADYGLRTSEEFLELNPGVDLSKPLTGEFYIF